ncbi:hypothetical protein DPMN_134832 [Dreissena polymorpha]|uniref:G-protein coupled receptors family 1 profile domain-containing protein n=1 Tax=Dreissena polymorpha TaxID=45954 RepID=A0A9D4JB20_DREPO|nr:hypothetical protein DPMN_134832 [Dreissena polymorpha]
MAMWFTVSLAVFRYILVCHHGIGNRLCSLQRAILTIAIIVIANIFVAIPDLFLYRVVKQNDLGYNFSGYRFIDSHLVEKYSFYKAFNFWFYGVSMKVVPCILLILLSTMVIVAMRQASERRVRLLQQTRPADHDTNHEHTRTTWMLVSVVMFSVLTEMPHGILVMVSGLNKAFFKEVYSKLNDVIDLLILLNSAVNFVLYCIMSHKFRYTFKNLFVVNLRCGKRKVQNLRVNGHTNGVPYFISTNMENTRL